MKITDDDKMLTFPSDKKGTMITLQTFPSRVDHTGMFEKAQTHTQKKKKTQQACSIPSFKPGLETQRKNIVDMNVDDGFRAAGI